MIFNDHTAAILSVLRRPGQTSLKRTAWKSGNGYRIHMKITCKAFHTMMQGTDRKLAQRRLSLSTCTGRTPFRASRVLMKKICWTDEPPTRHVTNLKAIGIFSGCSTTAGYKLLGILWHLFGQNLTID